MKQRMYIMRYDREEFQLWRITRNHNTAGWKIINRRYLGQIGDRIVSGLRMRDDPFLLACMVLASGEYEQRHRLKKKLDPKTVYAKQNVLTCTAYARITLKKGGEYKKMETMQSLKQVLSDALKPVRERLNLPAENPAGLFYAITDEVIASVDGPECQLYLERQGALGSITEKRFIELETELMARFPDDADFAIKALKKTKTREPLSLISLDVRKGIRLVSLVNPDGGLLQMDASRFMELLSHPNTPLLLAFHTKQDPVAYKDRPVVFNNNVTGRVVAKFMPDRSRITVLCLQEDRDDLQDKADFILDADYMVCLFIVLERLRDDEVEYRRMKEKADVTLVGLDPFDKFHN